MRKTICVFCAASDVAGKYVRDTKKLAKLMVKNNYNLVWGGTNKGLMKVIAEEVQKAGGKIIGITVEHLKQGRRMNSDEMIIAKDIAERKKLLLKRADALVMLVGGIGSLDEVTEMMELKKHKLHQKPIIILNTANFYEGLKKQLTRMVRDGFIKQNLNELIFFAATPKQTIKYINDY